VAEGGGLLNRYTVQKLYPGFESLPHRQKSLILNKFLSGNLHFANSLPRFLLVLSWSAQGRAIRRACRTLEKIGPAPMLNRETLAEIWKPTSEPGMG
jgi:hypothetical protein